VADHLSQLATLAAGGGGGTSGGAGADLPRARKGPNPPGALPGFERLAQRAGRITAAAEELAGVEAAELAWGAVRDAAGARTSDAAATIRNAAVLLEVAAALPRLATTVSAATPSAAAAATPAAAAVTGANEGGGGGGDPVAACWALDAALTLRVDAAAAAANSSTGDGEAGARFAHNAQYRVEEARATLRGRVVQVDPVQPKLKPPGTNLLKLKCDIMLSTSAFKFNVRRYSEGSHGRRTTWLPVVAAVSGPARAKAGATVVEVKGGWNIARRSCCPVPRLTRCGSRRWRGGGAQRTQRSVGRCRLTLG